MNSATTLIGNAWSTYKTGLSTYIGIVVLPIVAAFLFAIVFGFEIERDLRNGSAFEVFDVVLILILAVLNILSSIALIKAASDPTMSIKDAYQFAFPRFWSILLLSLMVGLTVAFGLVLLIVPGIIFAVWFAFSTIILIYEDKRGTAAMKQSKQYVRGRWWAVAGRIALLIVVVVIIAIAFDTIGSMLGAQLEELVKLLSTIVTAPLSAIYMYYLYGEVKQTVGNTSEQGETAAVPDASTSGTQA